MSDDKHFEVLSLDYEMAREDERTFQNIQAAVVAVTVALLAAIGTVVSDACQLIKQKGCTNFPDLFLAGAPSIPLASLAFLQLLGVVSSLRSYYLRAVEKELRTYATSPLSDLNTVGTVKPGSYMGLMGEVTTMRRGRAGYRVMAIMIMLIALGFFGGLTWYIATRLGGVYERAMFVFYGLAFGILIVDVWAATVGARSTFVRIAIRFVERQGRPVLASDSDAQRPQSGSEVGRSFASYLILPRPEDLIKWLFIPFVFLVSSWSQGSGFNWGKMLLTLLIFEYLVYSARYQWNDIRGIEEDAEHPHSQARRRLPYTAAAEKSQKRYLVYNSLCVAAGRVVGAVTLAWIAGNIALVLILVGIVFGIAGIYEVLRNIESRTPVEEDTHPRQYIIAATLWLLVGAGYSLRFLAGFYAAGIAPISSLALTGALYAFFFGVMFVLLTWVLEAASYCRSESDREWYVVDDQWLRAKPHLILLLSFLCSPKVRLGRKAGAPSSGDRQREPVLANRKTSRPWAPWNLSYLAASICGVLLGTRLAVEGDSTPSSIFLALSTAVAICVILLGVKSKPMGAAIALLSLLVIGAAQREMDFNITDGILLVTPWLVLTMTYIGFRQQSYSDLKEFPVRLANGLEGLKVRLIKILVGRNTWGAISPNSRAD
ncbi:hypothetical protein ACFWYA_13015 [Streptomyces sp. NPDC059011]|uniref:hypothetical protein n=1 Tax=unclassified Streptomyces TaxID=2593676 RepID=UPI0036CC4467